MAKILNKFMEYIGFGRTMSSTTKNRRTVSERRRLFPRNGKNPRNAAFCQREMLSAFPESIAER